MKKTKNVNPKLELIRKNNLALVRHPDSCPPMEGNSGSRNYDLDSPPKADRHLLARMTEKVQTPLPLSHPEFNSGSRNSNLDSSSLAGMTEEVRA